MGAARVRDISFLVQSLDLHSPQLVSSPAVPRSFSARRTSGVRLGTRLRPSTDRFIHAWERSVLGTSVGRLSRSLTNARRWKRRPVGLDSDLYVPAASAVDVIQ